MGSVARHELAAAVSDAGGLGTIAGARAPIAAELAAARKLTDRPCCTPRSAVPCGGGVAPRRDRGQTRFDLTTDRGALQSRAITGHQKSTAPTGRLGP